jgi:putative spermidine/putrescine transport system substrate-binding protein
MKRGGPRLRVIGRSEILLAPIRERASRDLGFDIDFELIDGIEGLQRVVTQPDSFDVYHQWHTIELIWTARSIQAIDLSRIEHGEEIKARANAGRGSGRLIETVFDRLFLQPDGTLGSKPSDHIAMLPSIHGVDALGYLTPLREELGTGKPDSWGWLLDKRFHGRTAIMSDPVLGMIEAALAVEAAEGVVFGDIGNLSIEEIDLVADLLLHKKRTGHFKGVWRNYEEAARLMQRGGVVLQSMFSPAVSMLRRNGMPISIAVPAEGCRGWHADLCISVRTQGAALDAAYEYLNWWHDGWAGACLARQGYYSTFTDRLRSCLEPEEWAYWYEGLPAEKALNDPLGIPAIQPGDVREGGSHIQRMLSVRVWNTFMDEHTYLVRRWKEFLDA